MGRKTPVEARPSAPACPVVGIGASAGGLEALERFFGGVPAGSGLAFVVVQHLAPNRPGIMAEILQRTTPMSVRQITDRTVVRPDHVYVIPPNKDLSILHGVLHLLDPSERRGLRLPVDFFLRTLADDLRERSVGVVLSGMGSDGTLGLRAIHEKGGLTLAQDPPSAGFGSMPQSAIDAGVADVVAPAEALPERILAWARRGAGTPPTDAPLGTMEKVIILLRQRTGNDFSLYKESTLHRRIERRMGIHQVDGIDRYVCYLRESPQELDLLFKELLIGVTSFFRDPAVWDHLAQEVLPNLVASPPAGPGLRAWIPGCSTGEEAYSLAMVYREALDGLAPDATRPTLQIFATDLDREAVEVARTGAFPRNIAADVPPERLKRFFVETDDGYRVTPEIRGMVIFAPQNVIMDPPFTRLDLLICRNLLIYLTAALQTKLLPLFHYSLRPRGVLILGSAETPGSAADLFDPLDSRLKIYRRREVASAAVGLDFPSAFARTAHLPESRPMTTPPMNLESLAEQLVLRQFSPAAALVSDQGDILYTSARTGRYLEPSVGKANLNIFAMAREGLRHELSEALQRALRDETEVTVRNLTVGTNGDTRMVDLTVQPVRSPEALQGTLLVVFSDVAAPARPRRKGGKPGPADAARVGALESEVQRLQEELQSVREEMQASHEELKAANEELQSTNEELQSTNEELTTSKEELQSLNEELQTVNAELQSNLDDLSQANSDMSNLLNSTEIGTIFLNRDLSVRRFTDKATKVFKLIPGDVGRPLSDLVTELAYPELTADAEAVLRTLAFKEKQVRTRAGGRYRVRIMPYRTQEDRIDGLVLTFIDVTAEQGSGPA